jgi:hypothetical protein
MPNFLGFGARYSAIFPNRFNEVAPLFTDPKPTGGHFRSPRVGRCGFHRKVARGGAGEAGDGGGHHRDAGATLRAVRGQVGAVFAPRHPLPGASWLPATEGGRLAKKHVN